MAGRYDFNAKSANRDILELTDGQFELYTYKPDHKIRYKIARSGACYFSATDAVVYLSLKEVAAYIQGAVVMKNYVKRGAEEPRSPSGEEA